MCWPSSGGRAARSRPKQELPGQGDVLPGGVRRCAAVDQPVARAVRYRPEVATALAYFHIFNIVQVGEAQITFIGGTLA